MKAQFEDCKLLIHPELLSRFRFAVLERAGDVLHLMSFVSLLDQDLAVVNRKIMPVPMFQLLQTRGIQMIDVADEEYDTLGCNVLAVAPRHALMVEGSPVTRARLQAAGCRVQEFSGKEIVIKGSGGPTCLTRPVWRRQD
jgi:N-dimethylarginine dimethylaminohydrolase